MKRLILALPLLATAGAAVAEDAERAQDEQQMIAGSGDMLQIAVPLLGLGLTFLLQDPKASGAADWTLGDTLAIDGSPRRRFMVAATRSELVTFALKAGVAEQRPNGGQHSFPSGHTSIAFMGAEFIRTEYGWGWGVPAFVAASYVGWSRVATNNHYPQDVVAGAAIGVLSNHNLSDLRMPFGTLSIMPGLVALNAEPAYGLTASALDAADSTPTLAAGISFNLQFGGRR